MKYTIELTNKQKAQMDCMMEIVHRYVGFNPKLEPMVKDNTEVCNKDLDDFENLFVHEHDYEQFFEDTYGSKDPDYNLYDLVVKYGAKKVIDDLKKWEEKKKAEEEIKVGDEVKDLSTNNIGVVLSIGQQMIIYMTKINHIYSNTRGSLEKTGRHFDEVKQLLGKLRGEE